MKHGMSDRDVFVAMTCPVEGMHFDSCSTQAMRTLYRTGKLRRPPLIPANGLLR